MAIYHLSARPPIARAAGRSATAAAAYRAGTLISDSRTGMTFDYRRRRGVLDARLQLPEGRIVPDRSAFWNSVEEFHRRGDAVVAREVVVALPAELGPAERANLAFNFALDIANEFGVAVDCAIHAPALDGDDRNYHAHLLLTACGVSSDGVLGKKAARLDPIACRRNGVPDSVSWLRPRWQDLVNAALETSGSSQRVDHRSHQARKIARHPTVHTGKKGASARARAGQNARQRAKNRQIAAIESALSKLERMRARLAALQAKARGRDEAAKDLPDPQLPAPGLRDPAPASDPSENRAPWRRRRNSRSL